MNFIADLIEKMAKTLDADVKAVVFDEGMDGDPEEVIADYGGRRLEVTYEDVLRTTATSCNRFAWSLDDFPGHVIWLVTGKWE